MEGHLKKILKSTNSLAITNCLFFQLSQKMKYFSRKVPKTLYLYCLSSFLFQLDGKNYHRASLVAQWLRIRLPTQGTQVQALVWEDPTCRGATRPMSHNY